MIPLQICHLSSTEAGTDGANQKKILSNVILSDKGPIQILKDKHRSITIKKDGSEHEYPLEELSEEKSLPDEIKDATTVSDLIDARDEDIAKFQKLFVAASKDLFVLQDKKRFCVTNRSGFKSWIVRAEQSGIKMLYRFAKTIRKHFQSIQNHYVFPISTGILESINNKIKALIK